MSTEERGNVRFTMSWVTKWDYVNTYIDIYLYNIIYISICIFLLDREKLICEYITLFETKIAPEN